MLNLAIAVDFNDSDECLMVNITILKDKVFEDSETFTVVAGYVTSSNVTVRTLSTITILDDDSESKLNTASFTL